MQMDNERRIVTIEKVIEKSKQWTLEGDCTLMQWMDQISKNLEERVTKTSSALNDLSTNLDRTSIALSNATNNLAALQYSQFVENRVHDDDETLANIADVPNPVTDVTDSTNSIVSFLKKNLEKMNSCHEALSISYDDSDEDEPAINVIYRSKNPYEARSLPHIYGSNLWKEKWHIGLCDSDNDFSGDENSEQFSESSSSEDDSYESTAPTLSEWDSTAWGLNTNHIERKEIHTPSNDGESSYQGEINSQSEVSTPKVQRDRPSAQPVQDQRFYQHVPRKEDNIFDDIFSDSERPHVVHDVPQPIPQFVPQVVASPQKTINQGNFIADEPPPDAQAIENDTNRRIGAKKPLNLFDDDEFSSFMDQIVQTANNKNTKSVNPTVEKLEPQKKPVVPNLFDDSEDVFASKLSEDPVIRKKEMSTKLEDDMFMAPPLPAISEKTKTRNIFDDDDDDDDFEKIFAAKTSGSSEFLQKTKNLFEDDLETLGNPHVATRTISVKEATVKELPFKRQQLFDDEDDELAKRDDIFGRTPDKNDFHDDMFSNRKGDNSIKNGLGLKNDLFDDIEQADINTDEVANSKIKVIPREEVSQAMPSISKSAAVQETGRFADVFHDKPPNDIFASSSEKRKTLGADIFADDFTDDFDEFIPKSTLKEKPVIANKDSESDDISQNPVPKVDNTDLVSSDISQNLKSSIAPKLPDIARKPTAPINDDKDQDQISAEKISPPKEGIPRPQSENSKTVIRALDSFPPIIFEDTNRPTVSSHITSNPDTTPEVEKQPKVTVPSYTSLFQDEPPSDDENLIASSYEEAPKYSADENVTLNTPSVPPYSSINLFAEVPPDDDFTIVPTLETKRIHSIFYDDFHETIEASREMRVPSTYIFNEEPPPDDDPRTPKIIVGDKPAFVEEKKEQPKVSKLKKNDLQINVSALLPTAKIPLLKKPESTSVSVVNSPSKVSTRKSPEKRDLPENILPNLNRDRAKVQVKRRPSTRKGRQESYRKSMIEDEIIITAEQIEYDHQKDEILQKAESIFEDFGTFDAKNSNVGESNSNGNLPKQDVFKTRTSVKKIPKRPSLFEDSDNFVKQSEQSTISMTPSLFEKSDTDVGTIFEPLKRKSPETDISSAAKILDSLFDSDDIDENLLRQSTKSLPISSTAATESVTHLPQPFEKTQVTDPVEKKKSMTATPTATAFMPREEPAKPLSLFGESDDGSDDLFKGSTTPNKSVTQKTAEKRDKPKSVSKPVKPASSLFSSDEESGSGDDIFGKPKTKASSKKIESAKAKLSSSLFADLSDDDDDDLFGSARKRPSGVEKSKSKHLTTTTQTTKISAVTPQQTAASNNPLADLLDD